MLYALMVKWKRFLAEFFTILVGVLAAFWMNNLGEHFQEKKRELFYIEAFIKSLRADGEQLETIIQAQSQINATLDLFMAHATDARVSADTLNAIYTRTTHNPTFFPGLGVYKSIIAEGALSIISNKTLLTHLVQLYEYEYERAVYLGKVIDNQTEKIFWEGRLEYSLKQQKFYKMDAAQRQKSYAAAEYRQAFILLYIGHLKKMQRQMQALHNSLETERAQLK